MAVENSSSNDNNDWIKVKGDELKFKVIETKDPSLKMPKIDLNSLKDDDDESDDSGVQIEELDDDDENNQDKEDEPQKVKYLDHVLLDYKCKHEDTIVQEATSWLVQIGIKEVVAAVDMVVEQHGKVGQTLQIESSSKFAFGDAARTYKGYIVPPNSTVTFTVQIKQVVMDTSRLNPYFPITRAQTKKQIANDLYVCQFNNISSREHAIKLYQKAGNEMAILINGTYFNSVEPDHPQKIQTQQLCIDCFNNVVAVYLQAKQWQQARDAANVVLKHDSKNSKALVRRVKATVQLYNKQLLQKDEVEMAIQKAENQITYKNPKEESELSTLQKQFKKLVISREAANE